MVVGGSRKRCGYAGRLGDGGYAMPEVVTLEVGSGGGTRDAGRGVSWGETGVRGSTWEGAWTPTRIYETTKALH